MIDILLIPAKIHVFVKIGRNITGYFVKIERKTDYVYDKIGRINTLFGALILAVAGMLLLFICRNGTIAAFFIGMALVGLCFGTFMGVYPGFTSDEFGAENNTVNYGIMWIGFCIAGVVGPMVLSSVYANTGTYKTAFLIAVLLAGAGIMFTFVYRKMKSKKNSGGNKV